MTIGPETARRRWRRPVGVGVTMIVAVALVVWLIRVTSPAPAQPPATAPTGATAPITVTTLREIAVVDGELGYGAADPIQSRAPGTVTWLPDVGTVLSAGDVLLRADERPVVLLDGPLPMYRSLALNATGRDVEQFERNLRDLGYGGFTVDTGFTAATATAVKRWQRQLGLEETGAVDVGAVVYAIGTIRIAGRSVRVGASATGEVLTYTAQGRVVTVQAPAAGAVWARTGTAVTVVLPGAVEVAGLVSAVGSVASAGGSQSGSQSGSQAGSESGSGGAQDATVPVTVTVADQAALGDLERAPVEIRYTARQRVDVLTVPVIALLAPIEGGYALEIVDGAQTRVVAVETGMFADGRVEVRGQGIVAGASVRVPS